MTAPDGILAAALAPTGRLRAAINLGNPVLARQDGAQAEPSGISVDLARALAARLGLELDLVVVEKAAASVAAVKADQADIGFFAIDPLRSEGIAFTRAYLQIEGAYLVRADSSLTRNDDVDDARWRIVVSQGSAYDLHLSREIRHAQILRAPRPTEVMPWFHDQGIEVAAGIRPQLEQYAAAQAGLRLLPGRFMVIEQAMGLPASRPAAAQAALRDFVESAKASGLVRQSMDRHGVTAASVAP